MLIDGLIEAARERLVDNAKLIDVAKFLSAGTDLVMVCDSDGVLTGVVTKTDLVKQISTCHDAVCMLPVATVMTRDVAFCRGSDSLADVSQLMN